MDTGLRAYDNSSSRSMSLLLPMISRQLTMSLLAFSDIVSDLILVIALFSSVEKVFSLFGLIGLKSCRFHLSSSTKALAPFWCNTTRWETNEILSLILKWIYHRLKVATRICQSCSSRSIRVLFRSFRVLLIFTSREFTLLHNSSTLVVT